MTSSSSRFDRRLNGAAAAGAATLGLLAVLAPRAMPVWAIVMTALALVLLLRRDGPAGVRPRRPATAGLAAGFLGLVALGTAWSPSPRAVPTALEIGYVAAGALVLGRWIVSLPQDEGRRVGRLFLAGVAAGSALLAVNLVFDHPLNRWWHGLPDTALILASNVPKRSAAILALLIWPAAALAAGRIGGRRGWWAGAALAGAYAVGSIATGSRSAQLGMAAGLAAWGAAWIAPEAVRRGLAVALIAAFVGAVPFAARLAGDGRLDSADWLFASAQHRIEIWGRTAARVPDAPLLGHGIDASRALTPRPGEVSRFETLDTSLLPLHPHNAFLQLWLELGLIGGGLALGLALSALATIRRLPAQARPFALGLFASGLAMANTAYGLWQAWWMAAYLAGGLMMALAAAPRTATDPP